MFVNDNSAKQAKSGSMSRKGPLDTFVVRTPSA